MSNVRQTKFIVQEKIVTNFRFTENVDFSIQMQKLSLSNIAITSTMSETEESSTLPVVFDRWSWTDFSFQSC